MNSRGSESYFPHLDIGLAEVIGLAAIVLALLVSRIRDIEFVYHQVVLTRRFLRTWVSARLIAKSHITYVSLIVLKLLGIAVSILFLSYCYRYLNLSDIVSSQFESMDSAIIQSIWDYARITKSKCLLVGSITVALLLIEWLILIIVSPYLTRLKSSDIPSTPHPFSPKRTGSSWRATWNYRIEIAAGIIPPQESEELFDARSSGSWDRDWAQWTKAVIAWHMVVDQRHLSSDG